MKKYIVTFVLNLWFIGVNAQQHIFLKYESPLITGNSVTSGYVGQVEINNLSYNVTNVITKNSSFTNISGPNAIVSNPSSPGFITFYNAINESTPKTSDSFYHRDVLDKIIITLTKGGNSLLPYCVMKLEDCRIASIQNFGDFQEKIQILAGKITITYTPFINTQAQTPVTKGWNYVTNSAL